jgi:cephalosporin hydroxylase
MIATEQNPHPATTSMGPEITPAPLVGEDLKQAVFKFEGEIRAKMKERQHGVPTFCDNTVLSLIRQLRQLDPALPWEESIKRLGAAGAQAGAALEHLRLFLLRKGQGRFVNYDERFRQTAEGHVSERDIGYYEFITSQGVEECMQWKGVPLFKTVYDFSIYTMMLWSLRPQTIIELGSGMGSSAVWMADLLKAFAIDGHIYSLDLRSPALEYEGITFMEGDSQKIEESFPVEMLKGLPHPWLFVEDAHVNVQGVMRHFHPYFESGDYVVIEDSGQKQDDIKQFLTEHPDGYKLDTAYTDFFGRNATCSRDSIFVKV